MAALANVGTELRLALAACGRVSSINRATEDAAEHLHPVAVVERPCVRRPRTVLNDDTDKYILFEAKKPLSATLSAMNVQGIKFYEPSAAFVTRKRVLWRVDAEAVPEADMPAAALAAFARLMVTFLPSTWQKLMHLSVVRSSQQHTAAVDKAIRDELMALGTTPLGFATTKGNVAAVRRLLKSKGTNGVLSTAQNRDKGWTALHLAAYYGHLEVSKLLLAAGADAKAVTTRTRCTAADVACYKGFVYLAAYLRQACTAAGPAAVPPAAASCGVGTKRPREEPPSDLEVVGTRTPQEAEADMLFQAKAAGNYIELE